jgi:glycosyltransferase involved in cell wall biosynthesis
MIHLFVNSLAASAGGGLTYIRNVIPHLASTPDLRVTVALSPELRQEFGGWSNIEFLELDTRLAKRFWFEQFRLPKLIRHCEADVLLSTGNFALRNSPIPQVLLSRNSIYTCADYYRDLRTRHEYGTWLDTLIRAAVAKRSIHWSDITVAPSKAFADELNRWTDESIVTIHHGFDYEAFTGGSDSLAPDVEQKLAAAEGSLKLLFVSHYNYYRNFETLIRALPLLRDRLAGPPVKLLLTCNLLAGTNPGSYRPAAAAKLVREVGAPEMVVELGPIPYRQLHRLYRCSDLYVTPAYTETFAHPLVEAMASGLPIVASDLPVHREICEDAAEYFPRFSEEALAQTVAQVLTSSDRANQMAAIGAARARQFSWKLHVQKVVELCRSLMNSK